MKIDIYTTPTCGYCHQAKDFLAQRGVPFTEHDVSRDQAAAEEMVRRTGQMGVPVIVVDGEAIIGFDRPRLESLLAGAGGRRPRLGLKVSDAGNTARKPGEPPLFGVLVGAVSPASPGERAGIKTGDVITDVNRNRINNTDELEQVLGGLAPGNRVPVVFYRDDQPIRAELAL